MSEFISTIRLMRLAQKNYFKHRDRASLNESIRLEKIVDTELQKLSGESK